MKTDKNFSVAMMAISKGKESTESNSFKRYIGIAPCYVLTVNPTKEQMEKMFDTTLEKEPEYVGTQDVDEDGGKVTYPNVRINFFVKPDPDKIGFETSPIGVSLYLRKQFRFNKDKTKVQVIDKYGRTAWVTSEECKNHQIPMYSNGPANLDKDYRPAYVGEEELTNFIVSYLNIPSVMRYNNTDKKWYMVDNPQDSECRLDHIEDYFKGDFKELAELLTYQPSNKVKVMFGVKTSDEGKQYQAVFTKMFLRNSVNDYSKIEKALNEAKSNGAYSNVEFAVCEFKEYVVEPTDLSASSTNVADNFPFGAPSNPNNFWGE